MAEELLIQAALSLEEANELATCEQVIEAGLKTFVEVGRALLSIRDKRLYRADFDTFDNYCRDRWQMSKTQANRLTDAYCVIENLTPIGVKLPANESQARPLATLDLQDVFARVYSKWYQHHVRPTSYFTYARRTLRTWFGTHFDYVTAGVPRLAGTECAKINNC